MQIQPHLDTLIRHAIDLRVLAHQYSRTLTALAAITLMGTGATAYAVASASKSQADLFNSVTQIVEPVQHQYAYLRSDVIPWSVGINVNFHVVRVVVL